MIAPGTKTQDDSDHYRDLRDGDRILEVDEFWDSTSGQFIPIHESASISSRWMVGVPYSSQFFVRARRPMLPAQFSHRGAAQRPRRFVKMFKPQFAPGVKAGTKRQTVRPTPLRRPKVGDTIDCREWTGKPYRSPQRRLGLGKITLVADCRISDEGVMIGTFCQSYEIMGQPGGNREKFAVADGFRSFGEMLDWFRREHGLPFVGILIKWEPLEAA